ncbi:amino acid adenylation domain-containing protein [Nonomuraea sp. MTCD27]|uniref:non-ribosomal peptide synthetase n=1 Tax=Nonomuraea sp. MTCD27 TaxID=1676747 RepID=UPI0035C0FE5C
MNRPTQLLHRLVEEQTARTPDAVAVIGGDGTLTYAELDRRAERAAARLRELGVHADDVVAVVMDRSVETVVALLATLKAGGAYVPIETATPAARRERILLDSGAKAVFAARDLGGGPPRVSLEGTAGGCLPAVRVDPGNLCAVYYTSGSTGNPKGVACTHRGWVTRMRWMQRTHALRPGETVLHKTTLTFDDAAVEIFWPLMAGGRIALPAPGDHRDPRAIIDAAIAYEAVHVQFVPSVLELFLDALTPADVAGLARLRTVLSSGEALRPDLVRAFHERFGDRVALENTWGATEASIDSTQHPCGRIDGEVEGGVVSLGRPIDGNEVHVLGDDLERLPPGEPGELYIGGHSLARGYLGDPRRTAEAFLPHPFVPGARLYRTGDRGVARADGSFEYLDRIDRQVKIRGVRLELAEVEAVLRGHDEVVNAAATTWEAAPGDKRLAVYAVLEPEATATPETLHGYLSGLLPAYAVPSAIKILDELPLLPNGKLDRRSLPAPEPEAPSAGQVAPRTVAEQAVAEIWQDVLGRPSIGVEDDFFVIGGHSLLATKVVNRIRSAFGTDFPLSVMFERPTVAGTAAALEELLVAEITDNIGGHHAR